MIREIAEQVQADSGLDVVAYLIAGLPATVGALGALYVAIDSRRHNREIREQVSNDHDTNLRDDVDRAIAGVSRAIEGVERVEAVASRIDERTRRIGNEQHRDRDARRDGDRRLADQLAKLDERLEQHLIEERRDIT